MTIPNLDSLTTPTTRLVIYYFWRLSDSICIGDYSASIIALSQPSLTAQNDGRVDRPARRCPFIGGFRHLCNLESSDRKAGIALAESALPSPFPDSQRNWLAWKVLILDTIWPLASQLLLATASLKESLTASSRVKRLAQSRIELALLESRLK